MTKHEAIQAMREGKKVTHRFFTPTEYIYLKGNEIYSEDGAFHSMFWELHKTDAWLIDWDIFEEQKPVPPTLVDNSEEGLLDGETTEQKVSTAWKQHTSKGGYLEKDMMSFRAGFIYGNVRGEEEGSLWGLNQNKKEVEELKQRLSVMEDVCSTILAIQALERMERYDIADRLKNILLNK